MNKLVFADYLAQDEATRCLGCYEAPCQAACPAGIDVPGFINRILTGDWRNAARLIWEKNSLPSICAIVCPQENLCMGACLGKEIRRGPDIGTLQYYAIQKGLAHLSADTEKTNSPAKIAVIGSGPSGLACAADLAARGHQVTVFEKGSKAGGCLVDGIPEHRLSRELAREEIARLQRTGVEFLYNKTFGIDVTWADLKEKGYKALFIGTGLPESLSLSIPGENLAGVFTDRDILAWDFDFPQHLEKVTRAAVIGGGNVAMDVATVLKKAGVPEVFLLYRRSQQEMPAWREEIHHALDQGVVFELQSMPLEILGDGQVEGIKCMRTGALGLGKDGRINYVGMPGTEYVLKFDLVVTALGNRGDRKMADVLPGVQFSHKGQIEVDPDTMVTGRAGIFAGGDVVADGGNTVVRAVADGRKAARAIMDYVENGVVSIGQG